MYSKTGLSLLAVAGLAAGVIGMQIGAANGATDTSATGCATAPSANTSGSNLPTDNGSVGSTNGSGASAGAGATTNNGTGTGTGATTGNSGSNGNGSANGTSGNGGNGSPNGGTVTTPGTTTGPSTLPGTTLGTGSSSGAGTTTVTLPSTTSPSNTTTTDRPFLDIEGNSNVASATGGSVPAPPTATHVVAHSPILGGLINVSAHANAGH